MKFDIDKAKEKEVEIFSQLVGTFQKLNLDKNDAEKCSQLIVHSSIEITPPEKEEITMEFITVDPSGRNGGKSIKPGNITLNMRKLVDSIASGTFAIVSAYQIPWLAPLAFITIWNSLHRSTKVQLTENDAAIIWTMWVNRDRESRTIPEHGLLEIVNQHLHLHQRGTISPKDLTQSLRNLETIKCIKRTNDTSSTWWLREWVKPTYH